MNTSYFFAALSVVTIIGGTGYANDFSGIYTEIVVGPAQGTHVLSYQHDGLNVSGDLYTLKIKGSVFGATLGYRHQLFSSPVYLGVEFTGHMGGLDASEHWEDSYHTPYGNVGAALDVSYSVDALYTATVQVGYQFHESWLLYAGLGASAADTQVCGTVTVYAGPHSANYDDCTEGYAVGPYGEVGIKYKSPDQNWMIGLEFQQYKYAATEEFNYHEYDLGSLTAVADHWAVAMTFGYQF